LSEVSTIKQSIFGIVTKRNGKEGKVKIIKQKSKIKSISVSTPLSLIENGARLCTNSQNKQSIDSIDFVKRLLNKEIPHKSTLKFVSVIVDIETDRAMTHQIVRHRLCSFLQQSQRYVRMDNISFIEPEGYNAADSGWQVWERQMQSSEDAYLEMIAYGKQPQQARKVLPNSTATTIRIKTNLSEWLHIFTVRCDPAADPQMQNLMIPLLHDFAAIIPVVFDDLIKKYPLERERAIAI